MRVRTMRIGWPQHGQRNAARGFTQAVRDGVGMTFNTSCNNAIMAALVAAHRKHAIEHDPQGLEEAWRERQRALYPTTGWCMPRPRWAGQPRCWST